MSKTRLLGAALAGVLVSVGGYAQDIISFNFADGYPLISNQTAGADAYNTANWNNLLTDWSGNAGAVPNPLRYNDDNAISGMAISFDAPNTWRNGVVSNSGDTALMKGYMDSNNGDSPYFKLSGIPYPKYDVVLYVDGDNGGGGTDGPYLIRAGQNTTVQGASSEAGINLTYAITPAVYLKEGTDFSGTYTQVPLSSVTTAGAATGNYIVFTNIAGRIVIDPTQCNSPGTRAPLNGVQIVRNTDWALTSAGAGEGAWVSPNTIETISTNLTIGRLYTSRDYRIDPAATIRLTEGDLEMGLQNQWIQAPGGGVGGTITSTNGTLYLRQNDPELGDLQIRAVFADDGATPVQLIKVGHGSLMLNAFNTYSGGTIISNGTLHSYRAGNDTQSVLPPGQPVTIEAGARLRLGSISDGIGWFAGNPSVITNRGTFTAATGYHHSIGRFVLNGGVIASEGAGDGAGNYILDGQIDVIGTASSIISANSISLRGGGGTTGIVFNVGSGAVATNLLVTSVITGGGKLVKDGAGTMVLSGSNTYSGATDILAGTLRVNGTYTGGGVTTIFGDATLGGTGVIGPVTVSNNGTLAPGNSAGTLTLSGGMILNGGAILDYELDAPNYAVGGGGSDFITGVTDLTLDGFLDVTALAGFMPTNGAQWKLIGYSGALTDIGLQLGTTPPLGGGLAYAIATDTSGVFLNVIPEPATIGLFGLALAAAFLRRRMRG